MTEADFRNALDEYKDVIASIEILEISEEENISNLRSRLRVYDGTILWVREIRNKESIVSYSYYWLRSDETVIIGWDNAPHHNEVSSFPNHKHIGNKIEASQESNLRDVLNFIKKFLG